MPIYEYVCSACGGRFDHLAKSMTDRQKPECPECGSSKAERVHSTFSARRDLAQEARPAGPCASCSDDTCPMRGSD